MVGMPFQDHRRAIQLFHQDGTRHAVWQGHARQGQQGLGPLLETRVQAVGAADDEVEIDALRNGAGELLRTPQRAPFVQGNHRGLPG